MAILGISDSHNAAAALLRSGAPLRALQEERPSRIKNHFDVPAESIAWLLREAGLAAADVEEVALCNTVALKPMDRAGTLAYFREAGRRSGALRDALRHTGLRKWRWRQLRARRLRRYRQLGFRRDQLREYDHHLCHAATAYYGKAAPETVLVVTCDGAGDDLCATVSLGESGALRRLHEVNASHSVGTLFALVTYMTGMVPNEHEYKLMGMAPYAAPAAARRVRDKLLGLFEWDGGGKPTWARRPGVPPVIRLQPTLETLFFEERFDAVMGGAQMFVEAMAVELVRRAVRGTGIRRVRLAGGVFMNVKANKLIGELEEVEDLFVFPSCGDETTAIGAAWLAQARRHGSAGPLGEFYLGPDWSESQIEAALAPFRTRGEIAVEKPASINEAVLARLLSGEVVGRFAGREEFGARSLGNRAIIADPRRASVIQRINDMVKSRDFWMPFASSVMAEAAGDYLVNPKNLSAPHMILSFDTTPEGAEKLAAGVHPYDKTCRPQVVEREANPEYWDLLKRFRDATGVGGLLNTSLNLHGLPLTHRPEDALEVLLKSGLNVLQLGPFLVTKARADA